jgi:hypothetical protein
MSQGGPVLLCCALAVPKQGHSAEEYEDAVAADVEGGRFAIADGAADSSFAALWAQLLVTEFVAAPAEGLVCWPEWLGPLQRTWAERVGVQPLPWYAEAKLEQGAFATFLGVVVRGGLWRALAVGDSCLFHVRAGQLEQAFPLTRSADFDNTPWLVGSRVPGGEAIELRSQRAEGIWRPGDRLWLMTDALGQWFLEETERQNRPWGELEALVGSGVPQQAFADWVSALREARRLRNDDVTLLLVEQQ